MQENEPVKKNLSDVFEEEDLNIEDFSIFENQGEVAENLKKSAEELGIQTSGIDKIKDGKPLEFLVAKKNCKMCWGKGTVDFVPNHPKYKSGKKRSALSSSSNSLLDVSSGPKKDVNIHPKHRNTSLPEDRFERQARVEKALCRCVRLQME